MEMLFGAKHFLSILTLILKYKGKHLNDVFKKETGMTLQKYHCQMRMERAARLLQQTDLTITQISERLGFDEVFYFSNVFKKQMKLSPMSYRKKCVRI